MCTFISKKHGDFKNFQVEIEKPAFVDPYLMFMLLASFKFKAEGDTYTKNLVIGLFLMKRKNGV
jgi:hypothetical protein